MSIILNITDNNNTHSKFYTFIVFYSPKHVDSSKLYRKFRYILNKKLVRKTRWQMAYIQTVTSLSWGRPYHNNVILSDSSAMTYTCVSNE